jgi:hydrogenase maturation protease
MGEERAGLTWSSAAMAPTLVFGIGNPSRGDDALGPLLIERLERLAAAGRLPGVALLTDFQLQIEHVEDLVERRRVIFVDAAVGLQAPCALTAIAPTTSHSWTTHRLAPAALLHLYQSLYGPPPRVELLAIRAEQFELGAALSEPASRNLDAAIERLLAILAEIHGAEVKATQQP